METFIQNKSRKKMMLKVAGGQRKKAERKLVPGKSLEQIRIEAVRQLREMGILV